MVCCCVPYCHSSHRKRAKGISFHGFPSNLNLRQQWLIAIARKNFSVNDTSTSSVVCSKHFRAEDYLQKLKCKRLVRNAVPSIFENYPSYLVSKTNNIRRDINRNTTDQEESVCDIAKSPTTKSERKFDNCDLEISEQHFRAEDYRQGNAVPSCLVPKTNNIKRDINRKTTDQEENVCDIAKSPTTKCERNFDNCDLEISEQHFRAEDYRQGNAVPSSLVPKTNNIRRDINRKTTDQEENVCDIAKSPTTKCERNFDNCDLEILESDQNVSRLADVHEKEPVGFNFLSTVLKRKRTEVKLLKSRLWKKDTEIKILRAKLKSVEEKLNHYKNNNHHSALEKIIVVNAELKNKSANFILHQVDNFFVKRPTWNDEG